MWYIAVLYTIVLAIVLAIAINEDVVRIVKCKYWSSETMRIILLVGKYELAYWHSNNTGYRAFVFCLWRLHIGYYSVVNRSDEDDEKPKFTACLKAFEGKAFEGDWAYGILRLGAGITRFHALYMELADSTTWPHETEPESTVSLLQVNVLHRAADK